MRSEEGGDTPREIVRGEARVVVSRDLDALSALAAELFVTLAQRAGAVEGNRFTVALSGGETPRRLYTVLATTAYAPQLPWERVHLFWGDERHVPPDHPESNYRMTHETLLSRVPVPPENVYRVRAELREAGEAARVYEDVLRGYFTLLPDELPCFDLVLLGLGVDGHTASLFPGTAVLHDREHLVAAPWGDKLKAYRITLTPRVLNNAATVVFLVSGAAKAAVLHAVLDAPVARRRGRGRPTIGCSLCCPRANCERCEARVLEPGGEQARAQGRLGWARRAVQP